MNENDEAMIIVEDLVYVKTSCIHMQEAISDLQNDGLVVRDHIIRMQDELAAMRKELAEMRVKLSNR